MVELHRRKALAKRVGDVAGECCNATFARQCVADQRQMANGCGPAIAGTSVGILIKDDIDVEHTPRLPGAQGRGRHEMPPRLKRTGHAMVQFFFAVAQSFSSHCSTNQSNE